MKAKRVRVTTKDLRSGDYLLTPSGHILVEKITTEEHFLFGTIRCLHRSQDGHTLPPVCYQDCARWDVLR